MITPAKQRSNDEYFTERFLKTPKKQQDPIVGRSVVISKSSSASKFENKYARASGSKINHKLSFQKNEISTNSHASRERLGSISIVRKSIREYPQKKCRSNSFRIPHAKFHLDSSFIFESIVPEGKENNKNETNKIHQEDSCELGESILSDTPIMLREVKNSILGQDDKSTLKYKLNNIKQGFVKMGQSKQSGQGIAGEFLAEKAAILSSQKANHLKSLSNISEIEIKLKKELESNLLRQKYMHKSKLYTDLLPKTVQSLKINLSQMHTKELELDNLIDMLEKEAMKAVRYRDRLREEIDKLKYKQYKNGIIKKLYRQLQEEVDELKNRHLIAEQKAKIQKLNILSAYEKTQREICNYKAMEVAFFVADENDTNIIRLKNRVLYLKRRIAEHNH